MIFKTLPLAAAAIALPFAPVLAQAQTDPAPAEQAPSAQQSTTSSSTEATTQQPPAGQTENAPAASSDAVVLATPADVKVGTVVNDQNGQNVGKIETVEADGAVIATDKAKAKVPLSSFGKKGDTLVVGISKAEFEAAVAKSSTSPTQ